MKDMNTFNEKLFEAVDQVYLNSDYLKYHKHVISDININTGDVIKEYGNDAANGLYTSSNLFTVQEESDGYLIKLKKVPSPGDIWNLSLDITIEGNNFTNSVDEVSNTFTDRESFSKENSDIGYSIKGGKDCPEGVIIRVKNGTSVKIHVDGGSTEVIPDGIKVPIDEIVYAGTPLNDRFIYGSAVKGFIGKEVIPLITALEERIKTLEGSA